MTTADMSLVAKESIVVEKLKNYMPAQFFCPILYILKQFNNNLNFKYIYHQKYIFPLH